MERVKHINHIKIPDPLHVLAGIGFCLITSYLFYDLSIFSVPLIFTIPFIIRLLRKRKEEAERWKLRIAFADGLRFMKNGLQAGYSAERCLEYATAELSKLYGEKARITEGFSVMYARVGLGIPMEEALREFADSTGIEDIREFAEVFRILKRTGGSLSKVIKQTVSNLQDRIELKRDLNVVAAEKMGEFRIMCIVPYGILFYLKLFSPSMTEGLYHNITGVIFMTAAFLAYVFLLWLGLHILSGRMKE